MGKCALFLFLILKQHFVNNTRYLLFVDAHCCSIWAKYWYDSAHASTGFNSFDASSATTAAAAKAKAGLKVRTALSAEQVELYREVLPFYDLLRRRAIGVDPLSPGSSVKPKSAAGEGPTTVIDHGLAVTSSSTSSLSRLSDPRNANLLVWVGDRLLPRELAKVSVFDSAVQGGDAVWEGLRVYGNTVFKLDEHINRLFDSARAMAFEHVPSRAFVKNAVFSTLHANGMTAGGAHMRMTLSRGAKITSSMNPQFNIFGTNLIIVPEWKPVGDMATYDNNKVVWCACFLVISEFVGGGVARDLLTCTFRYCTTCRHLSN